MSKSTIVGANGASLDKTALLAKTTAYTPPPRVRITEDIYETYYTVGSTRVSKRKRFYAGQVVAAAEIDRWYAEHGVVASVPSPATGPAAGNTLVTITGSNLDAVTSVTFGGTAGTALTKARDGKSLTVRTPAKTAGAYNVVLVAPTGSVTKTNAFTYA